MSGTHAILIALACLVLLPVAICIAFLLRLMFGTEFTDGEIHECVGCRGYELKECQGCKYNPEYWSGTTYTGPNRRELRKIRKETQT